MPNLNHINRAGRPTGEAVCLRRAEVARRLGVSVRSVERWAVVGGGPPFKIVGGTCLYPVAALERWASTGLVGSTSDATTRGRAA